MAQICPKTFCLNDYDVFGFDLDGCLLKYKWRDFFEYTHTYLVTYLTKVCGYDACLFQSYTKAWTNIMCRGVILDTKRGNILKVAGDGMIRRAYHGTRKLLSDEIEAVYYKSKLPVYEDMLREYNHTEEFHIVEATLEEPVIVLYTELVDAYDSKLLEGATLESVWDNLLCAYVNYFNTEQTDLAERFTDLIRQPNRCCKPLSNDVLQWLLSLKAQNKTVFLMTSSYKAFAAPMLDYLFESEPNKYFDFFIENAKKPSFFYGDRIFIDSDDPSQEVTKFSPGRWYKQGCYSTFSKLLKQRIGRQEPKVLYVGDGLKNDICPPKKHCQWGTLFILEGLEVEAIENNTEIHEKLKKNKIVSDNEKIHLASNPVWGNILTENGEETLMGRVTRMYADLTVPWLDYITDLPLDHKFTMFDSQAKTSGYYPPLDPMPVETASVEL